MELVTIIHNNRPLQLPRLFLRADDLAACFAVDREGLHLKCITNNGEIKNFIPLSDGKFELDPTINKYNLVAVNNDTHRLINNDSSSSSRTPNVRYGHGSMNNENNEMRTPTIAYGRRGNAGLRAVPGFKRKSNSSPVLPVPLGRKKKEETKSKKKISIWLSGIKKIEKDRNREFFHQEDLRNKEPVKFEPYPFYEVPVCLEEISCKEQVNVRSIIGEIRRQIGGMDYVITDKKGNPIRDMPNTRGAENWVGNKYIRAIDAIAYKKWRPATFELIKTDYEIYSSSSDSEFGDIPPPPSPSFSDLHFLNIQSSTNSSSSSTSTTVTNSPSTNVIETSTTQVASSSTHVSSTAMQNQSYVSNRDLLAEIERLEEINNRIESKIDQLPTLQPETLQPEVSQPEAVVSKADVKELLTCPICTCCNFDIVYCHTCNQFAGCKDCIYRVDSCPLCRASFSITCDGCSNEINFRPKSITIPGLRDILEE
ncbi:uncharacterized protein [Clytia hemisphaerica]|uniref:RING-type domain-containing protein n=1 Tax=Clytia hemisphaerica TaxID=252671 RepID=A0A7M5U0B1_9CNID|eukprot:TCONS_00053169-protein